MKFQQSSSFVRLATHVRRGALAMAVIVGSEAGAAAAPLTLSHGFGFADTTIPTFDTNLGALHEVQIHLNYALQVQTFLTPDRMDDMCSATVTGANVSVSAPGTPVLLSSTPSRPTESLACDSGFIQIIEIDWTTIAPVHFDAFTSVGPDTLSLVVTRLLDSATMTAHNPTETRQTTASWLGGGTVTYAYVPVPEPTTALMLTLGLAGLLAKRYRQRT